MRNFVLITALAFGLSATGAMANRAMDISTLAAASAGNSLNGLVTQVHKKHKKYKRYSNKHYRKYHSNNYRVYLDFYYGPRYSRKRNHHQYDKNHGIIDRAYERQKEILLEQR